LLIELGLPSFIYPEVRMTFDREEFRRQIAAHEAGELSTRILWGTYICPDCGMMQIRVLPWPSDNLCNNCPGTLVPFTLPASEPGPA
jgi:hypothetical protein